MKPSKGGKQWYEWMKEAPFYIYGFVYMFVRIAINVTMTMQPFYITRVTGFGNASVESEDKVKETPPQVAIVPLLSYIF